MPISLKSHFIYSLDGIIFCWGFVETDTYTEDEFKRVLKNLFSEKRRVRELEKQLEGKTLQKKFQAKLSDIHKISIAEEYAKLKEAYHNKELECDRLKHQLDQVRPVLKKLINELNRVRQELRGFKQQKQDEHHFRNPP
jgi:hypothetical protein